MDMVINLDHMPKEGETILAEKMDLFAGGKGANQAYTVAKLGGNVTMLGAVGDDTYGKILCENLNNVGVDVSKVKVEKNVPTGNAVITVNKEGQNSIIVVQGANKCVDIDYIDQNIDVVKNSDIIIMQLEIPLATVVYVSQKAKQYDKIVILDPAPANKNIPDILLNNIDVIKPNETELQILLNDESASMNLMNSADRLLKKGVNNVIVTLGKDGVYYKNNSGEELRHYSKKVKVVDTTAAGDSFTGALAVAISQNNDMKSSIEFADKVASYVVTKKGAQTSIPTLSELE